MMIYEETGTEKEREKDSQPVLVSDIIMITFLAPKSPPFPQPI